MSEDPGELAARALVWGVILILVLGTGALAFTVPPAAILPAFAAWKVYKFLAHQPESV